MFGTLETISKSQKQLALNEFFLYCRFDERCHRTLRQFAFILEKIGTSKQSLALKLWYKNVFKPMQLTNQTEQSNS